MSPHRIDPNVDYKGIHELSDEFTALWHKLQALYLDAAVGFIHVRAQVNEAQSGARQYVQGTELDSEAFQDTLQFDYAGLLPNGFVTSAIHRSTQGQAKARNAPMGDNFVLMAQLCVVSFYDFWNEYLRCEYAIAKGKLDSSERSKKKIDEITGIYAGHDLWGDLYYFRTSVVHKLGVANSDVAKCKIFTWFRPGEALAFQPDQMRSIFLALLAYRNQLFSQQFPEHFIQLPL
jgi:hypothetical protein